MFMLIYQFDVWITIYTVRTRLQETTIGKVLKV